jgi:hypothetical protein
MAEKSRLTVAHLSYSLSFFRQAREDCSQVLEIAQAHGWRRFALVGAGELADIAFLCAAAAGEISLLRAAAAGDSPAELTGMALVLGGGAGNIMDRYRQGYVTDYIRLPRLPGRMGKTVFNLGDFMILSGAALLITARAFSE